MAWDREITVAVAAAVAAGAEALGMQGRAAVRTKGDDSPVSEGDLAADRIIQDHLQAAFPRDAQLSEEQVDNPDRLAAERVWIIDPIDGTRDYVAGGDQWAVHIALSVAGRAVLGVVAVPGQHTVYWGSDGGGAWCRGGEREARQRHAVDGPASLVLSRRQFRNPDPVLDRAPEAPRFWCHSVGYKATLLCEGEAGWYIHPGTLHEWDVAAPAALLEAAGGSATGFDGLPFTFNQPSPVIENLVFSARDDHALVVARLAG